MTKTKTTRRFSFLILLCMLIIFQSSPFPAAARKSAGTAHYAAFGDSIAAGYGLSGYTNGQTEAPADSYQALLSKFLHTQSCNYAVTGDDSSACIELLNSGVADTDLKTADIVTLSIGSNDLLLPFIQIVMDFYNIQPGTIDPSLFADGFQMSDIDLSGLDMTQLPEYYKQSEALLAELTSNGQLHAQASAFSDKFRTILSILHEKAPDAEIYVTNIYNPFISVPKIGELAETYIQEINQAFSADDKDYTLIDVYTPFQKEELTNVHFDMKNPGSINPDPHPSIKGHQKIADLLIAALKDAHSPKAAVLSSVSTSRKTKLTVKIKLPENASGYDIRYASSKNGTYKTLASGSGKTYRTSSKKLKSGKTYYIRVRSYQTVKGVTYYGKNSNVKKITVK